MAEHQPAAAKAPGEPHPVSLNAALTARAGNSITGKIAAPGDKSISHRALLFGALAIGETRIEGLLASEDVIATGYCLQAMGVTIEGGPFNDSDDAKPVSCRVQGRGIFGLAKPSSDLDFGNSGTAARLMMGVLTGQKFPARLIGDASLSSRPMERVLKPLREMGLQVDGSASTKPGTLPLTVRGPGDLVPIRYVLPVASAQVKSAILLAGLHAAGRTTVVEPVATRDHTEIMLKAFGAEIAVWDEPDGRAITITGEPHLTGQEIIVPGDPSSAAFPIAAAMITPGSQVTVRNVLLNPTRTGFLTSVQEMGADIRFENMRQTGGEQVADIVVRHAALKAITVPATRAPSMIDEYPIFAVVAAHAEGETHMPGLEELRVKESDRLAITAAGLTANGVDVTEGTDSLTVRGVGPNGKVKGGATIATHLDHRIAMAFLTLGLATTNPVTIDDGRVIETSFPGFAALMCDLGADIRPTAAA
ncbi:MAG: 3-phosphoshikimate 1-carboxyvinyltransferase [Pseudomonadota bacterium]